MAGRVGGSRGGRPAWVVALGGLAVLAACSPDPSASAGHGQGGGSMPTTTVTTMARPPGPAAMLTGPVTVGHVIEPLSVQPVDLAAHGYREAEYFASGTAHEYEAVGTLPVDGRWTVRPTGSAPYETRIVVRRPVDPARFNGTVVLEWLNVSAGFEAAPDWTYMAGELLRAGYVWVGVSAQQLGVSGGAGLVPIPGVKAGKGLRGTEPARYGALHHPGDAYSYDIFTQIARALRQPGGVAGLDDLHVRHVIAAGESQSAFFLTTYVDAIQPLTDAFDAFFIHSRGSFAASLGTPGAPEPNGVRIRTDLHVPVLLFETETDLVYLGYFAARQPDTRWIRVWEVAGTAHADVYQVGDVAGLVGCKGLPNDGPQHFVVEAALAALDRWVDTGVPPHVAPRLEVVPGNPPRILRDGLGNALGGIRTPAVDVPVSALSGSAPTGSSLICALFGSTVPFDAATLVRLYRTKADYLAAYRQALDTSIAEGWILPADKGAVLAVADAVVFPAGG